MSLWGGGRGGVPGWERRVELADAVPLLGDEAEVHRPPAALEDRLEDAVVAVSVGAVDPLAMQAADAGAEPHADHAEGGEVDLGVAVGVGVVLFEVCAVTRRHFSAGANPARQLSLQPVTVGADDGGNDIV